MKKIIALLLALVMMMSLVACGPKEPTEPGEQTGDLAGTYDVKVWVAENIVDLSNFHLQAKQNHCANTENIRKYKKLILHKY